MERLVVVTFPVITFVPVRFPVAKRLPLIDSAELGVVVPMPTLPLLRTVKIFDEVAMVSSALPVAGVPVAISILPEASTWNADDELT